jgi:methylated-DNA-[protein]-cysteine S-methyltransferase
MPPSRFFTEIPSPLGPLTLIASDRHLTGLFLQHQKNQPGARASWTREDRRFEPAVAELTEYFTGRRRHFELAGALDAGTEFQRRVWRTLARIPYGETWSYAELARQVGSPAACRAVGLANSRNPLAIILPCHRVVGSDGSLTGYAGGLARKRFLLDLERQTAGSATPRGQPA